MVAPSHAVPLEEQIDRWRSYLRRRQAIHSADVAELEDHLREQIAGLTDAGLAPDEAFWPACNEALKQRGSLMIWFDPATTWEAAPTGKRGRQPSYSDPAHAFGEGRERDHQLWPAAGSG